jgi:asparagine synthetase B (glutamine-hydrolysing)
MGKTAADTVREIEETRSRLDSELRELETRVPAPAVWAKRIVGLAVGGGVVSTAIITLIRRKRASRDKRELRDIHKKLDRLEARLQKGGPAR